MKNKYKHELLSMRAKWKRKHGLILSGQEEIFWSMYKDSLEAKQEHQQET
jgi:hypothetical protein